MSYGLFLPLIALLAFAGCGSQDPDSPAAEGLRSMKGWELYSWPQNRDWRFALVPGTNRIKTFDEIAAASLASPAALVRALDELAPGEQVFWSIGLVPGTTLPPQEIVAAVQAHCQADSLSLAIDSQ